MENNKEPYEFQGRSEPGGIVPHGNHFRTYFYWAFFFCLAGAEASAAEKGCVHPDTHASARRTAKRPPPSSASLVPEHSLSREARGKERKIGTGEERERERKRRLY